MAAQILSSALSGIAKSMFTNYSRAAMGSYAGIRAMGQKSNLDIGDFNLLTVIDKNGAGGLEITDLRHLQETLKEVAPSLYRKLNRNLRKVGKPAQERVQEAYRQINSQGPLGGVRRQGRTFDKFATSTLGRLSWVNSKTLSQNEAVGLNFRNRNRARDWAKLQEGRDAVMSIVRISVNAPAFILADIAGAGKGRGALPVGQRTREYKTNLFGRGEITHDHVMTQKRVNAIWNKWIPALDKRKAAPKASRYAYPAIEKHMPKYRRDTSDVLNEVIRELNIRMAKVTPVSPNVKVKM